MQRGTLARQHRQKGPDVWQFRWSEKGHDGRRIYRKGVIGTIEEYPDAAAAREALAGLLIEINSIKTQLGFRSMTAAQLCNHFQQRELTDDHPWRSFATKQIYNVYLRRCILPHWARFRLSDIRTIEVESWLRRLPIAKSTCAKIRNLLSVVFNHACRYEFFDRNPIRLVRQSAKRRTAPTVLTHYFSAVADPNPSVCSLIFWGFMRRHVPTNLGPTINSSFNERGPFLSADVRRFTSHLTASADSEEMTSTSRSDVSVQENLNSSE